MLQLSSILREAGLSSNDYERCSTIPVILYDRKDRIDSCDDIQFIEPLFKRNEKSFERFKNFFENLEKQQLLPKSINVKIDEFHVCVFYKSPKVVCFSRQASIESFDFME